MKDICVVYVLDPSPNNHIAEEALLSTKSLRNHGGKYSNVPVYHIMPTSKYWDDSFTKTLIKLRSINNTEQIKNNMISNKQSVSTDGFIAKSAGLSWASEELKHESFLYLDCDTIFLKEPPFEKFTEKIYLHSARFKSHGEYLDKLIEYSNLIHNCLVFESMPYNHTFGWIALGKRNHKFWKDYYRGYLQLIEKFDSNLGVQNKLLGNKESLNYLEKRNNYKRYIRGLLDEVILSILYARYNALEISDVAQDIGVTDSTWVYHIDSIPLALKELKKTKKDHLLKCLL